MKKQKYNPRKSLYIPKDIHAWLETSAYKEERSVSQYAMMIIKKAMQKN